MTKRLLSIVSITTGVTVIFLDENKFQLFAPNADAMDEGRQMLEEFLKDDVWNVFMLSFRYFCST